MSALAGIPRVLLRKKILLAGILAIQIAITGCTDFIPPKGASQPSGGTLEITQIEVKSTSKNSVQIQWITNVAATSQVEYGTTTNYGLKTALDLVRVTNHSISLNELTPSQSYHFRVVSSAHGQQLSGNDQTFKTLGFIPVIARIAPNSGTTAGHTQVVITGSDFAPGASVKFGSTEAVNVFVDSATQIRTNTPPHGQGAVAVVVVNPLSQSSVPFDSFTYTQAPIPAPLSITTNSLPGGVLSTPYDVSFEATGGQTPYSWSVSSGHLPSGLTFSTSGSLSGKLSTSGTSTFAVQVKDASNATASKTFTVSVNAPAQAPEVSTTALSAGTVGLAYKATLQGAGGSAPYSWILGQGTLPAGLTLSTSGTISGTPSAAGTTTFVVQLNDSENRTATKTLSLTVNPKPASSPAVAPLQLGGTISASAATGVAYSGSLQAHGGTPPYRWSVTTGQLPAGIALSSTTGNISGTPTTSGQYTFALKVSDSAVVPQTAEASFTIAVTGVILDSYGGLTSMPSPNPSTGIFRAEKFGNKWMFVDPANNAFFVIAPYVLAQNMSNDNFGSNYYARTTAKYGDPGPTWGTAQLKRIQAWGFNSVGPYASKYVLPVSTDSRWATADHTNPVKLPFITMVRPAYYSMINLNHWGPQPTKNMFYGVSPYYRGFIPGSGVADYFDQSLTTFLNTELANDPLLKSIQQSPYRDYLIGVNSDDSDQTYGFGKGPDFPGGYNNAHLGWIVLTMSPTQTANPEKKTLYPDTVVYSKKALRDQLVAKYGTIASLNAAWGSSYTTFDSSGTAVSGEVVGAANGSTKTFTKTLAKSAVTKLSLQICVAGQVAAGDSGNGSIWGPQVTGTIDYQTGELSVTINPAPLTGATVTANYVQNGWGIGSGLLDEDGRPAHQAWTGIDFTFLSDTNANVKADLDEFLYQISAYYFSMCKTAIDRWIPGTLYLGPDSLGTWSAPSNRHVLKAASQYIDVMTMGGSAAMNQEMLDFIYTYYGDKPFSVGEFRTANGDSALFQYQSPSPQTDFPTQASRGQSYYTAVTQYPDMAYSTNGSRPYIGILWWQYLDNWGEKNDWGLVSLSDNAYDGREAVTGTGGIGVREFSCSPPLESYGCGGEERNYGNLVEGVAQAHQRVLQGVQQ